MPHPPSSSAPVALVTGASSGIGAAIAERLIAGGWSVYAAARRVDRMAALARAGARPLALDVTDDASMVAAVDGVVAETGGRLDALVNNAGYGAYGALEDVPLAEGRKRSQGQTQVSLVLAQIVQHGYDLLRVGQAIPRATRQVEKRRRASEVRRQSSFIIEAGGHEREIGRLLQG